MKRYVKTNTCKRKELLKHFNCNNWQHEVQHLCCDNFAAACNCGLPDCGLFASFPAFQGEITDATLSEKREVQSKQRKAV